MKGKKYVDALKKYDKTKQYDMGEAIEKAIEMATAKFDETLELHVKLGVDTRHADQQVRGVVVLPNGTGKTVRVLVIAKGAKADEAQAAGADYVGAEEYIEKITKQNWFEFDVLITTPDMMGLVGRMGKILGPKGLMPNPKSGTVTDGASAGFSSFIAEDFRSFRKNFSVLKDCGEANGRSHRRNGHVIVSFADAADDHNYVIIGKSFRNGFMYCGLFGIYAFSFDVGDPEHLEFFLNKGSYVILFYVAEKNYFRLQEITPFKLKIVFILPLLFLREKAKALVIDFASFNKRFDIKCFFRFLDHFKSGAGFGVFGSKHRAAILIGKN